MNKKLHHEYKVEILKKAIEESKEEFKYESRTMTVRAICSLYSEGFIDLYPDFITGYKWDTSEMSHIKSRFIEKIVAGLPQISSIMVDKNVVGIFNVADGMHRLTALFSFIGIYKGENDEVKNSFILQDCFHLPQLNGFVWDEAASKKNDNAPFLTKQLRSNFMKQKIRFTIFTGRFRLN